MREGRWWCGVEGEAGAVRGGVRWFQVGVRWGDWNSFLSLFLPLRACAPRISIGSNLDILGSFEDQFEIILGSCSNHVGINSESFWAHFGIMLESCYD